MSNPYLAEIRIVSFNFPPKGWAFCDGQVLPINQNQALFSLLGTFYGGDGKTTFALPDFRGRAPVHAGNGISLGGRAGEVSHTLTIGELPGHGHPATAHSTPSVPGVSPSNALPAPGEAASFASSIDTQMNASSVTAAGGGQPHENRPPHLVLVFIIALQGIYPSRN